MAEDVQIVLLNYLTKCYASLSQNLTGLLGNSDLASDALHDTWVRLKSKDDYGTVENPKAYLTRMSVNIALDAHRRQKRILTGEDVAAVLDEAADVAPGPERVAEARSDLTALQHLLDRMPERRRRIVYMVHCEGLEHREVAQRLGVSERTVAYELKRVHDAAAVQLGEKKK